ncbi:helix-turn-helix domain-containing protein [Winogradskya humida]|uniref:Transcriptional regulator n=1 Tax=Winogradskya humida TaxID=113566 RepID=A0ABQ3ZWX9_9ACTN|nr:helix-turn-helix transcriptional regulator [Actinoplanes humidus]GIE23117.1 transcriptional regulator [Actinoplanes humidus]
METSNALGEFLRARRAAVTPEDVGLAPGIRRRVPGLRREELALLAGISPDYYLRLEQGRDRHPSHQVVAALAVALRLDEIATAHIHGLSSPAPRRSVRRRAEKVPAGTSRLVTELPLPAYVVGRYFDVLAANPIAGVLSPSFMVGRNIARQLFLDPADRALYVDWERITAGMVGGLRSRTAMDSGDPRLAELVGELSIRSERFRSLWARAEVSDGRNGVSHLDHPQVGELHLLHEKLDVDTSGSMQLVIHHAAPDTGSAEALALLGTLAATAESPAAGSTRVRRGAEGRQ